VLVRGDLSPINNGLLYQSHKLQAVLLIGANDLDVAVTQAISMEAQPEPILIADFGKNATLVLFDHIREGHE
jgi:hypothetical protein